MRRRSPPNSQAGGVSLFPFLAVLLCTMGALIVVLIVIARQARIQVAEDEGNEPLRKELATQKEDLQWRIDMLRESRTKTLAQVDEKRRELSHLEDHSRRLRSELEELEQARREFAKLAAGGDVETGRLRREIEEINEKIAAKERELDDAIQKAGRGPSYAVVPYHGPNETRRRPIYIECRAEGAVLQPEGLVLTERDFMIDMGPSNPLISALRAAREYLSRNQRPGEEKAAYPLVLVRPDGVQIYEEVISAMGAWRSEFGYELIDEDWALEYPPADPKLTLAMRQAIGEGRLRQAYLAHAAPRLRSSGHHSFRASPNGGLMRDDGMPLDAEAPMAKRGGFAGRPDWARSSPTGGYGNASSPMGGYGGGSSRGDGKPAHRHSGNPYAAALGKSSDDSSDGAGGAGSDAAHGSGQGSFLGLGAGDLARGKLNAVPGSPTGVRIRGATAGESGLLSGSGGDSLLGAGQGSSALPSSGLLAGPGGGSGRTTGSAAGSQFGTGGNALGSRYGDAAAGRYPTSGRGLAAGGAPGSRGAQGRGGRGWGAAQDRIDALAAGVGAGSGNARSSNARGSNSLGGNSLGGNSPGGNSPGGGSLSSGLLGGSPGRSATGGGKGSGTGAGGSAAGNDETGAEAIGPGKLAGKAPSGAGDSPLGSGRGSSSNEGKSSNGQLAGGAAAIAGSAGAQRGTASAKTGKGNDGGSGGGSGGKPGDAGAPSGESLAADASNRNFAAGNSSGKGAAGGSAARGAANGSNAKNKSTDGIAGGSAAGAGDAESAGEGGAEGAVADAGNAAVAGGASGKPGGKAGKAASAGAGGGSTAGSASANSLSQGSPSPGSSFGGGGSPGGASGGSAGSQSGGSPGAQGSPGSPASSLGSSMAQPQQAGMPMPIPMPNMTFGQQSQQKSISEQRGEKNWANPAANQASSAITRPIKIVCDADHLTLLPEGRSRRGYKVIELGEDSEQNVRELVASVWDRIDSWGVAGHGMYWRPELIMEVEPGAEQRFRELKNLMADSGLDVRGRARAAAAVRYPSTKTPN